ncbi:MAG: SDR family NAD(P)-dependent oxidoreductase [Clostridia bacterium]|nr:SDR family NAD(P)-dependent oxidoreductase [Clostridia bacterium]MBR3591898.1 SDR family NAD(P)-dependent oxidoreductase [Clostridia bacterium]MBR4116871.1 SDR family NAD(P)-dependent oxidoreductase [Clostridia bacterium]
MKYYKWFNKNTSSLRGKTVAVSGATGGIGICVCEYLAYLGANIVCLDRNAQKSNKLIDNLKVKYPSLNAKHITVDLENMNQVKSVVESLRQIDIDYLILNAGAYKIPRHKCDTGFDNVFQINFVSPYYLARELAPLIKQKGGRIVAVSSIAHNYSKIDVNDIDFSTRSAASKVYGNAKRFLTFSLFGLFNNDETLSIVHPGITFTNITNHYPKLIFTLIKHPMKIIFMKPKKAALNIISGLFIGCKTNEWIGPKFFNVWGLPKKQKLNTASQYERDTICKITETIYKEEQ